MSETSTAVRPWHDVRSAIELPTATAWWVLAIHLITIASPALIVLVVERQSSYLAGVLDYPWLLSLSAIALVVASVCESAQNTLDRWYLTGTPRTLLDLFFSWLIVGALCLQALAASGTTPWVAGVAVILAVMFPVAYLAGWPIEPFQAAAGLAATVLLYRALDQPVLLLALLSVFLTVYCLDVLIRTRQQVMHGFTTGVNMLSVVAVALAIEWAAAGTGWSWGLTLGVFVGSIALAVVVRPRLLRIGPTPRP